MYLNSFLKQSGIFSKILDLNKSLFEVERNVDLIGISAYTLCADEALKLIPLLRDVYPHAKICVGGRHFTYSPKEGKDADFVVVGEGEEVLKDICEKKIEPGIVQGKEFEQLDDIYIDDESLEAIYGKGRVHATVLGSRGCVFDCVFCGDHSRKVRYHSPEYFVELLERISRKYTKNIMIADDIFTVNKKRAFEVCELLIKKSLGLDIKVFGHINVFDEELYKTMKRAGIREVCFGIESGDDNILRLIGKNFTAEKAFQVTQRVKKLGLKVHGLYMIGNIGETEASIVKTIDLKNRIGGSFWVSHAVPFPGTRFYEVAESYGKVIKKSWGNHTNETINFVPRGLTEQRLLELKNKF
jgi:radical SAM superfamily enzyme YgiQ (UPF0313 family)